MTSENLATMGDVKSMIAHLYSQLNVDQHQFEQEKILVQQLEELKLKVQPYEKVMSKHLIRVGKIRVGNFFFGIVFATFAVTK